MCHSAVAVAVLPAATESFRVALARVMAREGMSVNGLAKRLAELTGRTPESWRRQLTKYRAGVEPEEKAITEVASALGVSRSELPPAVGDLRQRVAELEQENQRLRRLLRGQP